MSPPPDIVYLTGPYGDRMEELRYSLRTVAANLPHRHVWIVGHKPSWVTGVHHLHIPQQPLPSGERKYLNAYRNWRTAVEHDQIGPHFYLFNDDFFAMHHDVTPQPTHRGTIRQLLTKLHHRPGGRGDYLTQLAAAGRHLETLGVPHPLAYETHTPLPVHRPTALDILRALPDDTTIIGHNQRSIYGNLANIGGTEQNDVRPARPGYWDWPWISTNDATFRRGQVGEYIRHRFPRPCRYEADTPPVTQRRAWVNTRTGHVRTLDPTSPRCGPLDDSSQWRAV